MYSILNEYFIFSQNNLIITVKHNVSVFFFVKSESTWNVDRWNKLLNEVLKVLKMMKLLITYVI